MSFFQGNALNNLSGWVLLDVKLLTMCIKFQKSCGSQFQCSLLLYQIIYIISFSQLPNSDGICLHVPQNRQFPKMTSKLLVYSTKMINTETLKLVNEYVSRKKNIQKNKKKEKIKVIYGMERSPGFEKVCFIAWKRQKDSRDPYSNVFFEVSRSSKIFERRDVSECQAH